MKIDNTLKRIIFIFLSSLLVSCDNEGDILTEHLENSEPTVVTGDVEFGFVNPQLDIQSISNHPQSTKIGQLNSINRPYAFRHIDNNTNVKDITKNAESLLFSINDNEGNAVYTNEVIKLVRVGDDILSPPLSFSPGTYTITLFQVLDASNSAIAMTPKASSSLSGLVSQSLDHTFTVSAETTSRVNLEVLSTETVTAEDFGYSTFSFTEVKLVSFLLSVFAYDTTSKNFELTESTIEIKHLGKDKVYYTDDYSAQTLTFQVPETKAEDVIQIKVTKSGYQTQTTTYTLAGLQPYFDPKPKGKGPLIFTLEEDQKIEGLVLHYDAANINSYSSSDTTKWKDLSGNDHHASINSANFVNEYGGGIKSSGSRSRGSSYIVVGNNPAYNAIQNITLEAWVKRGSSTGITDYQYVFSNSRDCCQNQNGYGLLFTENHLVLRIYNSTSDGVSSKKSDMSVGETYHVVGTYDGKVMKIYINGILDASKESDQGIGIPSSYPLQLGNMGYPYPRFFANTGTNYLMRIYNKALSADQVLRNYNTSKDRFLN